MRDYQEGKIQDYPRLYDRLQPGDDGEGQGAEGGVCILPVPRLLLYWRVMLPSPNKATAIVTFSSTNYNNHRLLPSLPNAIQKVSFSYSSTSIMRTQLKTLSRNLPAVSSQVSS
jgi:hypothetical protein